MNKIDCQITKITKPPYQAVTEFPELNGKWFVEIKYTAYGSHSVSTEMFDSKEEAESLRVGDIIQK